MKDSWSAWFRIPPFIGEVNYHTKEYILLFNTLYNCTVDIQINPIDSVKNQQEISVECEEGVMTRVVLAEPGSLKLFIHNHLTSTLVVDYNKHHNLCFVACDNPNIDITDTLWDDIDTETDICIHLGDNIYGDYAFRRGVKMVRDARKHTTQNKVRRRYSAELPVHEVANEYRQIYQDTWTRWASKLPNTSHICIWDDHDVVNNFNDTMIHTVPDAHNNDIVAAIVGTQMYHEYQEATRLDEGKNKPIYYKKINHNTGLLLIERITRLSSDTECPFPPELEKLLSKKLNKIQGGSVIIAFTSAPLPINEGKRGKLYRRKFGVDSLWSLQRLKALYDILFHWMGDHESRSIVLIGGDLHIGVNGYVTRGNRNIPLFVTSPISSHPGVIEKFYSSGYQNQYMLNEYTITLNQVKAVRNYLKMSVEDNGRIVGMLVFADQRHIAPWRRLREMIRMRYGR